MFEQVKKRLNLLFMLPVLFCAVFFQQAVCFAEKSDKADNVLNFVHVTDVHLDMSEKSTNRRMLGDSQELFRDAVSQINNFSDVQFVVFSGDVVNKPNKADFLKFINEANKLKVPWLYASGNHDVKPFGEFSKENIVKLLNENSPYFNRKSLNYSYSPNKKFLIIFTDGVIDDKITANGYFTEETLKFLDNEIKNNPDKKIIIVQHFPVVEPYKSNSHKVTNAGKYLETIDKHRNIIAVLSGHYHSTKITLRNNVLHISTPALVEYPNAFRRIKITSFPDCTSFEFDFIETGLKNVQSISKSRSVNVNLQEGFAKDRTGSIIIKNHKKF